MLKILDLVQLIHSNQLRQLPVYDFENSSSLYGDLYKKLAHDSYTSEEALARDMTYEGTKDTAYRSVKHRFKKHLLNTLFLVDFKKQDIGSYGEKYLELQRTLAQMEICLSLSKRNIGKECLLKAYKLANELDIPLAKLQIGLLQYNVLQKPLLNMADYGVVLMQIKYELLLKDVYQRSVLQASLDEEANEMLESVPVAQLARNGKFMYYLILSESHVNKLQYEKALRSAAEGTQAMQQYKYYPTTYFTILSNFQIVCAIQLKKYTLAKEVIAMMEKKVVLSPLNTLKVLEYKLILFFHTKKYQDAYSAYDAFKVDDHVRKSPDFFSKKYTEYYELLRAYFLILKKAGEIKPKKRDVSIGPARIYRFLNSIVVLKKNQNLFNVQIFIVTICLMIQEHKYDEAFTKIDSFVRYTYKHLQGEEFRRIRCFISLLKEASKSSFQKKHFSKKIDELYAELKYDTLHNKVLAIAVEYVPYHDLWDILYKKLK